MDSKNLFISGGLKYHPLRVYTVSGASKVSPVDLQVFIPKAAALGRASGLRVPECRGSLSVSSGCMTNDELQKPKRLIEVVYSGCPVAAQVAYSCNYIERYSG